jgi:hypothetical protein
MKRIPTLSFVGLLCALLLVGCATVGDQIVPTTVSKNISLKPGDLAQHGLAFLTPSTVTGQEQDRQSLALIFSETMGMSLPAVHLVPLSDTLGLINRAGLAGEYRKMFEGYRETGIFTRDSLQQIGQAVGTRYFAQLKLAGFNQNTFERFSLLGLRLFQTLHANIRLYLQIWDSETGVIAWEGNEELNYSYDSSVERPVTFQAVVEEAARHLITQLP